MVFVRAKGRAREQGIGVCWGRSDFGRRGHGFVHTQGGRGGEGRE